MYTLPTHISRYEIKHRIGRGGMGDLYLALDPNTNRLVALKLLNATLDSTELRERFSREARALAALNHPNIVNIYDTGEFEDSPFIVMEYVRGETLAELIKRRAPLSIAQKLKLIEELCAGLAQAHEADIIHRDIKPANLMVDQQGRLKILDFGIARVAEGSKTRSGLPLTQVNMQIGTPGYMSPEQIEGGEVDHRSDIFAVGAVCYELLAYDEAFAGASTRQIENRVLRGQPTPLASIVAGIDPEIDEIVRRALKRDPNKRYQDALTFARALERLRLRLGAEAPAAPQRSTPPPPQNQRGKSREARAEAAYQRALASFQTGSHDAARRSAVEALAEDPSHGGAHALLAEIEHRPVVDRKPSPPPRVIQTIVDTSVGSVQSTMLSEPTVVSGSTRAADHTRQSDPTRVSGGTRASDRTIAPASASAPTIVVTPPFDSAQGRPFDAPQGRPFDAAQSRPAKRAAAGATVWSRAVEFCNRISAAAQRPARGVSPRPATSGAQQAWWSRYRGATIAAAVVVGLAALGAIAVLIGWAVQPSGQLLTITRPVNGTILGPGIKCGTGGNDCTTRRPKDESVELNYQADPGFVLVSYTGDCAPGGRTAMNGARTCGGTFEKLESQPVAATRLLTISPVPTGGTVEGVDILCGTKGSLCAASHPDGVPVDLIATADPGFTFMGFVGDCQPLGKLQMTSARICSATFSRTPLTPPTPPPAPTPVVDGRGRGRGGVGSTSSSQAAGVSQGRGDSRPPSSTDHPPAPTDKPVVTVDPAKVAPVITPEEFAKQQIQTLVRQYCAAHDALDPEGVQHVFPTVDMAALRRQLNRSMYKSVQCRVGDPLVYVALDPANGTAKVDAELTRVWDHTVTGMQTTEHIATMSLSRPADRARWQIDSISFRVKPKK